MRPWRSQSERFGQYTNGTRSVTTRSAAVSADRVGIEAYRLRAVELLRLKRGDCVVDLACGTGLSFPLIVDRIGSEGRLIGVDLSPGMLACTRELVERSGWKNVDLVQSDMAAYHYPERVNAVLTVGALGYVPEYDRVIEGARHALVPGGRLVIIGGGTSG